jgi:diguanylate cyclase (GGDEF)-like protein/PAS domain S-box-containing protein
MSPFARSLWLTAALFAALALAFTIYVRSERQIDHANKLRYRSFLLADELRQSSDDLTRMVRTYVVTGDPHYKKNFQDILDIRDGKKSRPDGYQGIYWDFVLADDKLPRPDSRQAIALLELMRQAGFAEEEFRKLTEAKAKSDGLTTTEFEAMKLAESTGPNAEANRARARLMVHNDRYHQIKAAIMKPIDEFFGLMDQRTLEAIHKAEHNALILRGVFIAFGLGLMIALWRSYSALLATLGGSVDKVRAEIARIGGGDFSSVIPVDAGREDSVMGWLSATQAHLNDLDRERKAVETKLHRKNRLYAALSQCNQAVVRCTEETELFLQICRAVVHFGGMKLAWIGFTDPDTRVVVPIARLGYGAKNLEDLQISVDADNPLGRGPTGTAIRENRPFWCQDFINDSVTAPWHEQAKSFGWKASAALPLLKDGVVVGALNLYADQINAFDESVRNLLLEMAADISFALDNFAREAARQRAEQALKESLAKTQLLLDSALDAVVSMDHNGMVVGWSQQAEHLFGYSREQAMGCELGKLIVPLEYREAHRRGVARFMKTGTSAIIGKRIEIVGMRADGSKFPIELMVAALEQQEGYFFSAYARDITERKQTEADLRIAATAFESQEGMIITDANKIILKVNQAFTQITGYSAGDAVGRTPTILKSGRQDDQFYQALWNSLNQDKHWQGEIWNRRKSGEIYPEWLSISAVTDASDQVINYVGAFTDISRHKQAEETIHNLAFYDPLTRLPNRRLLLDRLNHALATSTRCLNHGAILFVDLDKFKELNDTSGHNIGDLLLVEVAKRLQGCVPKDDTIAHLGGDDFVIMLENLSEETEQAATQAEAVAEKILDTFNRPFDLQGCEHYSSTSIGISLFRDHESSVDDLLKHTETAMYQAKQYGRNTIRFFDPNTHAAMESRIALETDLRRALPEDQLRLYYQIQVDQSGHMLGAEALIRWLHPERGLVSPLQFIPLAEESGLILPIGQWVLETACTQLKAWGQDPSTQRLQLAVNVSATQFHQPGFIDQVLTVLQKTAINPSNLKLELTESIVLSDVNETILKMRTLKEIGVRFSLDDFGTGYSSLAYLTQLPLDQLKIDQSFVRNIGVNYNDAVIVQTIIGMANNLGMGVIAEGVETEEQRAFLEQHGCPLFQGYLFSKPVPIEQFEAFLKKG